MGDFVLKCLASHEKVSDRWKEKIIDFLPVDWKAIAETLSTSIHIYNDEKSTEPNKYKADEEIFKHPLAFVITKDYAGVLYDRSIAKTFIYGKKRMYKL